MNPQSPHWTTNTHGTPEGVLTTGVTGPRAILGTLSPQTWPVSRWNNLRISFPATSHPGDSFTPNLFQHITQKPRKTIFQSISHFPRNHLEIMFMLPKHSQNQYIIWQLQVPMAEHHFNSPCRQQPPGDTGEGGVGYGVCREGVWWMKRGLHYAFDISSFSLSTIPIIEVPHIKIPNHHTTQRARKRPQTQ